MNIDEAMAVEKMLEEETLEQGRFEVGTARDNSPWYGVSLILVQVPLCALAAA